MMSLRFGPLALGGAAALLAALFASNDAHACGGCFHEMNQPETTVVTGHRMAFSVSTTQTVLWDQIQYTGKPSDFAWVLPVKAGAFIETANDSWFEALDAATSTRVVPPPLNCVSNGGFDEGSGSSPGCGCGSVADSAGFGAAGAGGGSGVNVPPPVTVTHQGSIGPYDTVTIHANVKGALPMWLTSNGYAIDPTVAPIIDAYEGEGFDFIALRLKPDVGVQQMRPVRVVSPGASPTLPLRMVAAGTGANVDITLFVIGEGRWEGKNFPNALVDTSALTWDFTANASNFAALRQQVLAAGDGRNWLNTYAKKGALLSQIQNPTSGSPVQYSAGQFNPTTIAELYAFQGLINGETHTQSCTSAFSMYAQSGALVVNVCPNQGGGDADAGADAGPDDGGADGGGADGGAPCGMPQVGQIDARLFACDTLDDLAVALTGMHPRDVWLTRLESNLPHAALKDDYDIQAAASPSEIENWLTAQKPLNAPCQLAAAPIAPGSAGSGTSGPSRRRTELAFFAISLAALGAAFGRRAQRKALVPARSR